MDSGAYRPGIATALLGALLAVPASAQRGCKGDVCSYDLKDPVHTQKILSQRLPDYSRLNPQTAIFSPPPWLVFDPSGILVEQGINPGPTGMPVTTSRQKKDDHGRLIEDEEVTGGQRTTFRNEYVYGPHGPVETRLYKDGVLYLLTTDRYDERGNNVESCIYDPRGKLLSRSLSRFDDQGRDVEWELHGAGDTFQIHAVDAYDRDGDLESRDLLSTDGRILLSMAFRQTRLVSFFRDPECEGQSMGFVVSSGDRSTGYQVKDHCRLEITVEGHPGREGNQENDVTERYDEAWNLQEKVTYQYQRDRYGNWITRTISAWDPKTDTEVPIQEDRREISYYE
jgi:hypothetical protein